jgi:predicted transcriptional regulator
VPFTLRLQPELDRRLNEAARARGLTKKHLIEGVLRVWLQEQEGVTRERLRLIEGARR